MRIRLAIKRKASGSSRDGDIRAALLIDILAGDAN
jgi:hypothetical protein